MNKEYLDYYCVKPDQSIIEVKRNPRETIGEFIFNNDTHAYEFLGKANIDSKELTEILNSLNKLNKKTNLPSWLEWGMMRI
jgi:hypothetical protein